MTKIIQNLYPRLENKQVKHLVNKVSNWIKKSKRDLYDINLDNYPQDVRKESEITHKIAACGVVVYIWAATD